MALSPEEQQHRRHGGASRGRQLDLIELSLHDDDATLGSNARPRRRGILGGGTVLFGSVVLLTGVVAAQAWLGARVGIAFSPVGLLIGSVGMLAVVGWFFRLQRSPEAPHADRQSGRPGR